jgi:hypothetical protein
MKKALWVLWIFAVATSSIAQSSSTVIFRNRNVATSQPNPALAGYIPGGNGNGTYNVPIYTDETRAEGAGKLPGGVTVGLVYQDNLLATSILGTTTASAAYFVTPTAQEVQIKNANGTVPSPGSTPVLAIRAWSTSSGSYREAQLTPGAYWAEWTFISPPISGTPPGGGSELLPPTLTGWGPQDGSGVSLELSPISTHISSPLDYSIFGAPAVITTIGDVYIPTGDNFVLTNLTLFSNGVRFSSQSGSARRIIANTPPLAAGSYALTVVADGYLEPGGQVRSYTATPVNITVVAPVEILIAPSQIVNGEFQFNFAANPGLKYVIQTSADLFNWRPVATNMPNTNPALFAEPFAPAAMRYYKIERLPNP